MTAVSATLELEDAAETMEVLSVDKDLSFVNKVLLFHDAD